MISTALLPAVALTGPDLVNPMPLWQAAVGLAGIVLVVVVILFLISSGDGE